jgi:hypothetical protein
MNWNSTEITELRTGYITTSIPGTGNNFLFAKAKWELGSIQQLSRPKFVVGRGHLKLK